MTEPVGSPGRGQPDGAARIVEVGEKDVTAREATAECRFLASPDALRALLHGTPKGDPIEAAKVAGLMGAKRTPDLVPVEGSAGSDPAPAREGSTHVLPFEPHTPRASRLRLCARRTSHPEGHHP